MSEEIKRGRGRPKKNTTVETNTVQSSPTNSDTTYEFNSSKITIKFISCI